MMNNKAYKTEKNEVSPFKPKGKFEVWGYERKLKTLKKTHTLFYVTYIPWWKLKHFKIKRFSKSVPRIRFTAQWTR